MKIKYTIAAFALLAILAGCSTDKTTATTNPGNQTTTPVSEPDQPQDGVIEDLKNNAYIYSGLGQTQTLTYEGSPSELVPEGSGTQDVLWTENKKGSSYFNVIRTGVLSGFGNEKLRLDNSGAYMVGISDGELQNEALKMPHPFKVGVEWKTNLNLKKSGFLIRTTMTSKATREETISAAGQEFKCIVVESETTVTSDQPDSIEGRFKSVAYYAEGIGEVQLDASGTSLYGEDFEIHIELAKIGD